jgi:hypothetical protein
VVPRTLAFLWAGVSEIEAEFLSPGRQAKRIADIVRAAPQPGDENRSRAAFESLAVRSDLTLLGQAELVFYQQTGDVREGRRGMFTDDMGYLLPILQNNLQSAQLQGPDLGAEIELQAGTDDHGYGYVVIVENLPSAGLHCSVRVGADGGVIATMRASGVTCY